MPAKVRIFFYEIAFPFSFLALLPPFLHCFPLSLSSNRETKQAVPSGHHRLYVSQLQRTSDKAEPRALLVLRPRPKDLPGVVSQYLRLQCVPVARTVQADVPPAPNPRPDQLTLRSPSLISSPKKLSRLDFYGA